MIAAQGAAAFHAGGGVSHRSADVTASSRNDITRLLVEWGGGSEAALSELFPLVYQELKLMAQQQLRRERSAHTLQRTALVHEAFLRLVDQKNITWQSRTQFFGLASQMMRRILVDYARKRSAVKRGEAPVRVDLEEVIRYIPERGEPPPGTGVDLDRFDAVLRRLEEIDPRQGKLVELRFFGELTLEEAAEVMGISLATAKRDWKFARAWLQRQFAESVS
jgi:RNA polymerase sigma-70 factor, ECF subfamily